LIHSARLVADTAQDTLLLLAMVALVVVVVLELAYLNQVEPVTRLVRLLHRVQMVGTAIIQMQVVVVVVQLVLEA
jgi:hypothetical protein